MKAYFEKGKRVSNKMIRNGIQTEDSIDSELHTLSLFRETPN
jgi:hypothetical protein